MHKYGGSSVNIVDAIVQNGQVQAQKGLKSARSVAVLLLNILLVSAVVVIALQSESPIPESKAEVALYVGGRFMHASGLISWENGVTATLRMLEWMNVTAKVVTAQGINNGGLDGFLALYVPGGDMYQYSLEISAEGRENIRSFVETGGGYVGVCEGAFFASESYAWSNPKHRCMKATLGLLAGTAFGPTDALSCYPSYTMCKINIANNAHFIVDSEPEGHWMFYDGGPAFALRPAANAVILASYDESNDTAIVAFEKGLGRVVLIGAHPEFEEGSERDGVVFESNLEDKGSEWNLMRKAVLWCMRE
jgi:glutamine amidotransferase-like uncharacterized protein